MRGRTLLVGLAVTAAASGCVGGGASHHPTLTGAQALHQIRSDGFAQPSRDMHPASWRCDARTAEIGPPQNTGRYAAFTRPWYSISFGDRRVPPTSDHTARLVMLVVVFRSPRCAARCARDAIYAAKHFPLHPGSTKLTPYKVVSPTTINSGAFDTWLAHGRVFALGEAYTVKSSRIVQADLARVAGEIAG